MARKTVFFSLFVLVSKIPNRNLQTTLRHCFIAYFEWIEWEKKSKKNNKVHSLNFNNNHRQNRSRRRRLLQTLSTLKLNLQKNTQNKFWWMTFSFFASYFSRIRCLSLSRSFFLRVKYFHKNQDSAIERKGEEIRDLARYLYVSIIYVNIIEINENFPKLNSRWRKRNGEHLSSYINMFSLWNK